MAKKNKSPVQRLISWLKSVSDKFTDFFYTSKHGLTREQKNKMYDAFGKMARSIVDEKGNAVFRFNNCTKDIDIASGEPLPAMKFSVRDTVKNIVKISGKEFGEYAALKNCAKKLLIITVKICKAQAFLMLKLERLISIKTELSISLDPFI